MKRWLMVMAVLLALAWPRAAQATPSLMNVQFTATNCGFNPCYYILWSAPCRFVCEPLLEFPQFCPCAHADSFLCAGPQPGSCVPIAFTPFCCDCPSRSTVTWSYSVLVCCQTPINFQIRRTCCCCPCEQASLCTITCGGLSATNCSDFPNGGNFTIFAGQSGTAIYPFSFPEQPEPSLTVFVSPAAAPGAPEVDPAAGTTGLALLGSLLLLVERRQRKSLS